MPSHPAGPLRLTRQVGTLYVNYISIKLKKKSGPGDGLDMGREGEGDVQGDISGLFNWR